MCDGNVDCQNGRDEESCEEYDSDETYSEEVIDITTTVIPELDSGISEAFFVHLTSQMHFDMLELFFFLFFQDQCIKPCTKILKEVCGSDNVTYGNDCELENAVCTSTELFKVYDGPCQGDIFGGIVGTGKNFS